MVRSCKCVLWLSLLALIPALVAQAQPRRPRGIYAVVRLDQYVAQQQKTNPDITAAQLDTYFNGLFMGLLSNPAVSGLTLQVKWNDLNPNAPASAAPYNWSLVDDAFAQVAAWNTQNPAEAPKTIQLIVSAGFNSPSWMVNQIPSCDGLFMMPAQTPLSTCGAATFQGFGQGGGGVLPLPWNTFYKTSWNTFLTALAARYGSNPAFVSIAVAGPTAASAEMILPNDGNTPAQTAFGGIMPNAMWRQLLAFHYPNQAAYQNSDQGFIDEWNNAVDMYAQIFSGVTLVVTTGNGLPNLSSTFTIPSGFTADCGTPNMDCAAETAILARFMQPSFGGANAKATQISGMRGSRDGPAADLGVPGVKLLSRTTAQLTSPSAQILGGSQFDTLFSTDPIREGCTTPFPPNASNAPAGCVIPPSCTSEGCIPVVCIPQACLAPGITQASLAAYTTLNQVPAIDLISPEQAEYNVLSIYFDGTPVAAAFGGTTGTAPLNYLQIYSEDIQYATLHVTPAQIVEAGGVIVSVAAQDLLMLAHQKLFAIAEPPLVPAISSGGIVPGTVQPGEWMSIYGTNLGLDSAVWIGNFPTSLGGTSVTVNGKAAYLSFASYGQINVQTPGDTTMGSVPVVVTTSGGSAKSTVTLAPVGPAFFLLDGKHVAGIILRSDGSGAYGGGTYDILGPTGSSLGYQTVAAKAGDSIALFGNGFGPTNPAVEPGQPFSGAAATTNPVSMLVNSFSVAPSFAGLSGPGLYQFNLTIPKGIGTGDVPLQAFVAGAQTPAVVISLQ